MNAAATALDKFEAETTTKPRRPKTEGARATPRRPAPPAAKVEDASLLAAITRASNDPNASIDKLDRLIGLYERMQVDEARRAFTGAMNKAQTDMSPIAADAMNDETASRYATYAALDRALRPIYTRHGFTVTFDTETAELEGYERVICIVDHVDGHQRTHRADIPSDGKNDAGVTVMTRVHATAGAFTYGQRYLLGLAFNIAVDKDRDGNVVQQINVVSDHQVAELADLIDTTGAPQSQLLRLLKVSALADLPASQFEHAKRLLQARGVR
jgi:hypothetical protein